MQGQGTAFGTDLELFWDILLEDLFIDSWGSYENSTVILSIESYIRGAGPFPSKNVTVPKAVTEKRVALKDTKAVYKGPSIGQW